MVHVQGGQNDTSSIIYLNLYKEYLNVVTCKTRVVIHINN